MTIDEWLTHAADVLSATAIDSAKLDAELLLADALAADRTWLITHNDETIPEDTLETLQTNLSRRKNREPLAYIRDYKEFYGRKFIVTPDTLIPRPETETMIELLAPLVKRSARLIDVGTGSGAIAITAALEYPELTVAACDVSQAALKVANGNADLLNAKVKFYHSDLLHEVRGVFDIICANLPYVDPSWEVSEETHAEPALALYADDGGLVLIKKLIEQATTRLVDDGYLVLEADPRQHSEIIAFGHKYSFELVETKDFIVVLEKD